MPKLIFEKVKDLNLDFTDISPTPIIIFWIVPKCVSSFFFNDKSQNRLHQLLVILAFIWCIDHTSQANICSDMKFPKNYSTIL